MKPHEVKEIYNQSLASAVECLAGIGLNQLANQGENLRKKLLHGQLNLALVGATSSGKTTILNHLLQRELLKTRVKPNSGTLTVIRFLEAGQPECFLYQCDSRSETQVIDFAEFRLQAEKSDSQAILTAWLLPSGCFRPGAVLMDVPGYNSLEPVHQQAISQWLPEMDLLLWIVDARRGFARADACFADELSNTLKVVSCEGLTFILNCPNSSFTRRAEELRDGVRKHLSIQKPEVVTIKPVKTLPDLILDIKQLEARIAKLLHDEAREQLFMSNIEKLGCVWLANGRSEARLAVPENAGSSQITQINTIIMGLEDAFAKGKKLIRAFRDNALEHNRKSIDRLSETIKADFEKRMSETSCMEIDEVRRLLLEIAFPEILTGQANEFERWLSKKTCSLCEAIEEIWPDQLTLEQEFNDPELEEKARHVTGQAAAGKVGNILAREAAGQYLAGMGGAAGRSGVVGVMNLSRKAMGNINALAGKLGLGKVFGKGAMNAVGGVLKRIGLTTGRAISAFAFIATEAIEFGFKVFTWKGDLRNKLEPLLCIEPPSSNDQRPLYDLRMGMIEVIEDITVTLKNDLTREYEETKEILESRKQTCAAQTEERLRKKELLKRLEELSWPNLSPKGDN